MEPTTQNPIAQPSQDVFTRLGMASATDDQKQKLADQMSELVINRVINKASEKLSDTDMAYIEGLIDAGSGDQVEQALRDRLPDFDQMLAQTVVEVENNLVADQQAVMQQARAKAAAQ